MEKDKGRGKLFQELFFLGELTTHKIQAAKSLLASGGRGVENRPTIFHFRFKNGKFGGSLLFQG